MPPQAVAEVERRYPQGLPLLSPEEDMSITDAAYRKAHRCTGCSCTAAISRRGASEMWERQQRAFGAPRKLESAEDLLDKHPLAQAPDLDARLDALAQKQAWAFSGLQ